MSQHSWERLVDDLLIGTVAYDRSKFEKPGDFLKRRMDNMTEKEREMIQNASSKDWNHRPY
jgi:hypothetical protein